MLMRRKVEKKIITDAGERRDNGRYKILRQREEVRLITCAGELSSHGSTEGGPLPQERKGKKRSGTPLGTVFPLMQPKFALTLQEASISISTAGRSTQGPRCFPCMLFRGRSIHLQMIFKTRFTRDITSG